MNRRLFIFATAATITVGACKDDDATGSTGLPTRYVAAKNLWHAERPTHYTFVAARTCECTADGAGPVRIEVNGTQIISVKRVDSGAAVDPAIWFNVDDLFSLIDTEVAQRPDLLEVDYDEHDGHPTHLAYGHREVDAGAVIDVSEFTAVSGNTGVYLRR